jgi:hypothetical protein
VRKPDLRVTVFFKLLLDSPKVKMASHPNEREAAHVKYASRWGTALPSAGYNWQEKEKQSRTEKRRETKLKAEHMEKEKKGTNLSIHIVDDEIIGKKMVLVRWFLLCGLDGFFRSLDSLIDRVKQRIRSRNIRVILSRASHDNTKASLGH